MLEAHLTRADVEQYVIGALSEDASANERSHNALAQLSVSAGMRKDESAVVAQASCLRGRRASSLPKVCSKGFRRDARTPYRQDASATCD